MQPLSAFSECRNKVLCCRSFGHEREVNIQSDRNTVCWQYQERPQNIPGSADLVTSAQIPALSLYIARSSSDRSEHSASRLHHCRDNGARTLHRCSTQQRYYLRHQKTTKQVISIGLFYTVRCSHLKSALFVLSHNLSNLCLHYDTVTSETWLALVRRIANSAKLLLTINLNINFIAFINQKFTIRDL